MTSRLLSNVEVKLIKDKSLITNEEEWRKDTSEIFNGNIRIDNMSLNDCPTVPAINKRPLGYHVPTRLTPVLDLDESLRNEAKDSFGVVIRYKSYCFSTGKIDSAGIVTIQDFESLGNEHPFSNYVKGKYSIFLRTGEKGLTGVDIGTRVYIE